MKEIYRYIFYLFSELNKYNYMFIISLSVKLSVYLLLWQLPHRDTVSVTQDSETGAYVLTLLSLWFIWCLQLWKIQSWLKYYTWHFKVLKNVSVIVWN